MIANGDALRLTLVVRPQHGPVTGQRTAHVQGDAVWPTLCGGHAFAGGRRGAAGRELMTKDHDFKQLVRARMTKTGESYAAARRQLRVAGEATAHGGFLVSRGLLTQEQLDAALAEHDTTGRSLGRVLLDQNLVDDGELMAALADELGLELEAAIALRRPA